MHQTVELIPTGTTDDDDEQQPLTLDQWLARQRAEFEALRRKAHAELDEVLDRQWRVIEASRQRVARDVSGMTEH